MTVMHALGWALVHSLWQCAFAAAGLATILALVPLRAARLRYALATTTLFVMLALPIATAVRVQEATSAMRDDAAAVSGMHQGSASAGAPAERLALRSREAGRGYAKATPAVVALRLAARARTALEPALPAIVIAWFGGVLLLSLRLTWGWMTARRLGEAGTRPAPEACRAALARMAARLRITRPVRLVESAVVQVPAVIGWLRPVVLLPASALTGLTPLQLDALLAHELAHVRRYDYLVNLIQSVIETLLFYHPAVWWVSARVRQEREHCCDDLAVAACGDAHFYAMALLGMERLRTATPVFALTATGGSLMARVRRLVTPAQSEIFPRWIAGVVAVTLVVALGGGAGLVSATGMPRTAGSGAAPGLAPSGRTTPDSVLRHPDPARPLAGRWEWARAQARRVGGRAFWIGYSVRPAAPIGGGDTPREPASPDGATGVGFRGGPLAPLLGEGADVGDVALLFRFRPGPGGPVLTRVHSTSFRLPVEWDGGPLLWLGPADDDASLTRLDALFRDAPTTDLKEDVVAAVGMHRSSAMVVPLLARWLASAERSSVRIQAAEWLGAHPTPTAVIELARAARSDPDGDVREEAAEALRGNTLPAATDSLIALAQAGRDPDTRREAVQGLGHKNDPRVLAALTAITRDDHDEDVQREAVEALGAIRDGSGVPAVIDIARTHPNPEVRSRAVEAVAEAAPPAVALEVLRDVAQRDRDHHVQRKAVDDLGKVDDRRTAAVLTEFARHHPVRDVRREAVKQLRELDQPDSTAARLLEQVGLDGVDTELQRDAVEELGHLHNTWALAALGRLARTHPSTDVRREAMEHYAENAAPEPAHLLLTDRLANDRSPSVQKEAVEQLAELPDGLGIAAVSEAARSHPNQEVRTEARRRLDDRR